MNHRPTTQVVIRILPAMSPALEDMSKVAAGVYQ